MPPLRLLRALLFCLVLAPVWGLPSARALAGDIGTAPQIGSFGKFPPNPNGYLGSLTIQNAVHDATGAVYTVELFRVSKWDRDGTFLLSWNCSNCYGIDVNQATGDVYVTLQNNNLVQQFTSAGAFVRQWGSFGSGNGQFRGPHGIAVDPGTGNVYVYDTANGRIQVFDGQGNYLRQFGFGFFSTALNPGGLAFDAVNHWVYVSDPPFSRITKFTEDGAKLTSWGDPVGTAPGHLRWPRSVEVDGNGLVYVTDTDSERIQFFSPDGVYLGQFQGPQDLARGPFHPRDIAINRLTGEKYVNAAYAWREDKFDASNAYVKSFGGKSKDAYWLDAPSAIDVTPNGDVVIVDVGDFMMKRFSAGGGFRRQWAGSNRIDVTQPGLIGQGAHSAIAVDPDGEVWSGTVAVFYESDPPTPWIWGYSPLGVVTEFLNRKPIVNTTYEEQIRDIAIEPTTRDIFVSDDAFAKLKRIDRAGHNLIDFSVQSPAGLVFQNGKLFMLDYGANQVRRFSPALVEELPAYGGPGLGDGQFSFGPMTSFAVRADGEIFIADTNNHRLQELSPTGAFVAKRGTLGSNAGQFRFPQGVALSPNGDVLYAVDQLNFRVQMFCLTTTAACNALLDVDGDGLADPNDNCIDTPNPTQSNADGDALGDACDPCPNDALNDVDGDGVCGDVDNCPVVPNPDQLDTDGNGIGNACDVCPVGETDPDGDTICGADNCQYVKNTGQEDHGALLTTTPDGIGDACQCGDVAAGGVIDTDDLAAFRLELTQDPALSTPSPRCRVIDNHAGCSIVDVAVLQRALAALPPGIAQVCAAATPP